MLWQRYAQNAAGCGGGGGGSLWLAEAGRGAASVADGALRDPRVSGTLADP